MDTAFQVHQAMTRYRFKLLQSTAVVSSWWWPQILLQLYCHVQHIWHGCCRVPRRVLHQCAQGAQPWACWCSAITCLTSLGAGTGMSFMLLGKAREQSAQLGATLSIPTFSFRDLFLPTIISFLASLQSLLSEQETQMLMQYQWCFVQPLPIQLRTAIHAFLHICEFCSAQQRLLPCTQASFSCLIYSLPIPLQVYPTVWRCWQVPNDIRK